MMEMGSRPWRRAAIAFPEDAETCTTWDVWVRNNKYRKGPYRVCNQLPQELVAVLDELGVAWITRDVHTWDESFAELKAFKKKQGAFSNFSDESNRRLARWLITSHN